MSRNALFALFSLLVLVGSLVRVGYVVVHNPVDDIRSDPERHWQQGIDALRDDPMSLIDPVGYQLWVGALAKLTLKDRHLIAFYTALLSLVTPWVWYRALREIQPSKLVALGGWAVLAILPSWITIYGFFMQETLLLPLLGAALWATWRARRKRDVASFVVMTLAWALAGLTRGVVIPMAVVAAITVWWSQRERWKAAAAATLLLVGVLGPLTYRGYVGLGTFAPSGSGHLASLYARSGKATMRISYERGGETWANWFRSPATGDAPFAPLSDWKTSRSGVAKVHVDLDAGDRDWDAAKEAYPLSLDRYLSLASDNAAHLFFGTSWPDRVRGRTLDDLARHLRWMWAPLAFAVAVWTVRDWRRLRGERLLPVLVATWVVVQTLLPISVNEGRYRKPGEGLLIAQLVLLVSLGRRGFRGPGESSGSIASRRGAGGALVLVLLVGCGDGPTGPARTNPPSPPPVDLEVHAGCSVLQQRHCLLPFPSNELAVSEDSTDTGLRLALPEGHGPVNTGGSPPNFDEWTRSDGFSPGSPILVHAPGVDPVASGAPSITDLAASTHRDSATLLIDLATGERHPHWAEVDARGRAGDELLLLRPARNYADGHTYAVVVRGLVDGNGASLPVPEAFRAYRDRAPTTSDALEARRGAMVDLFDRLAGLGLERDSLWLAWTFTVASTRSLSERVLRMRDDAFSRLGFAAPSFVIENVQEAGANVRRRTSHYVYGSFEVPNYLEGEGGPGARFHRGSDDLPSVNPEHPVFEAQFACIVPTSAVEAPPARPVVYGHGLLGTRYEVVEAWDIVLMTSEHAMVYCATDWVGMSFGDAVTIGLGLAEVGRFASVPDRIQQSFVNQQYLARLLRHPAGFASDPAFQVDGRSFLDPTEVFFDGNSQGGILGGAATAVSVEWTRAVLGVPGMNFGALLDRSRAFDQYRPVLAGGYDDPVEQQLVLALVQMLWDRGESSGYANHMGRDPLPATPEHHVLLHVGFGDFQVADVTAFVEARSFGAAAHAPLLAPGRGQIDYAFGLPTIEYPWHGSGIVLWDSGVDAPPLTNRPPGGPHDPHQDPRYDEDARLQKSEFLAPDGAIVDVCGGPCVADRWG